MSIRPVDLQTLLPKLSEVQKARNVESEISKNNLNINIHKESEQHEKNTHLVVETKKSEGSKITRDGNQKGKQNMQENEHKNENKQGQAEEKKESIVKSSSKIDIRI